MQSTHLTSASGSDPSPLQFRESEPGRPSSSVISGELGSLPSSTSSRPSSWSSSSGRRGVLLSTRLRRSAALRSRVQFTPRWVSLGFCRAFQVGTSSTGPEDRYPEHRPTGAKSHAVDIVAVQHLALVADISTPRQRRKAGRPPRQWWTELQQPDPIPDTGHPYVAPGGICTRSGRQMLWECGDCGKAGRSGSTYWRSWVPCWRLDCETCHERTRARRGNRVFGAIGGRGVHAWVFTLPRHWCPDLGPRHVRALRRQVAAVLKDWYAAEYGVRVGFVVSVHPAGDRTPGVWGPHFDIVVPMVGADLLTGALVDLPGFHAPHRLDRIKRRWGRVLDTVATAMRFDGWDYGRPANVHHVYRDPSKPEKVRHRVTYSIRPWPAWSAGTFDRALSVPIRYGLLSSGVQSTTAQAYRERIRAEVSGENQVCPVCQGELDYVTTISIDESLVWAAAFNVAPLVHCWEEGPPATAPPPPKRRHWAAFCDHVVSKLAA